MDCFQRFRVLYFGYRIGKCSNQTAFFSNFAHEIGNLTLVIAFNFKTLQL